MKVLDTLKELCFIFAYAILASLFFIIWMIVYPLWYAVQVIKEHLQKHHNNDSDNTVQPIR